MALRHLYAREMENSGQRGREASPATIREREKQVNHLARKEAAKRADDAVANVDPGASDELIAGLIADALVLGPGHRSSYFHLSIIHDERGAGPCPLPYDWRRKNTLRISTRDPDRAKQWIIAATLAGYCVLRHWTRNGWGYGKGTLASVHERQATHPSTDERSRGALARPSERMI